MQDTTTQAMTELALGLSMAFFAIMILALVSMEQSKITHINTEPVSTHNIKGKNSDNNINLTQTTEKMNQATNTPNIVFYFKGKLITQFLKRISINQLSQNSSLVIAVEPNISFLDVVKLKNSIKHSKISITTINKEWLQRLAQQESKL